MNSIKIIESVIWSEKFETKRERKGRKASLLIFRMIICISNTDTCENPGFVDIKSTAVFTNDFKRQ